MPLKELKKIASLLKSGYIDDVGKLVAKGSGKLDDLIRNGKVVDHQIISNIDENTKVMFRRDVGKNAHPIRSKGYNKPVNHFNIEFQTKTSKGKWKKKNNFHLILDDDMNVIDYFN